MTIRPLKDTDLRFAQEVRAIAGWNQTDRDWRRLIESHPDGCFLAEVDGQPAATATTTSYGPDLAWIGMVLVHPDFRRRGIATGLLEHCVRFLLEETGHHCIKLDATPAGMPVYEKLGFQSEYEGARWEGKTLATASKPSLMDSLDSDAIPEIDRTAFGTDRSDYLRRLSTDSAASRRCDNSFGMIRRGTNASYLGPIVSDNPAIAESLVTQLLAEEPGKPVFWDIPEPNSAAVALATSLGFRRQRPLVRMWAGTRNTPGDPLLQWAISAPETG